MSDITTVVEPAPYRSTYFSRQAQAEAPNTEQAVSKVVIETIAKNMILSHPQHWSYATGNQMVNGVWNPFSLKVENSNSR